MKYGIAFLSLFYFISSFTINNSLAQAEKTPFAQVARNLEAMKQSELQEFHRIRLQVQTELQRPITVLTANETILELIHRASSLAASSNMDLQQKEILSQQVIDLQGIVQQIAELSSFQFEQCFERSSEAVKVFEIPGVLPSIPLSVDRELDRALPFVSEIQRLA